MPTERLNEHVVEVRFKPNPRVLDYRGEWAATIADKMELPDWKIIENRVDILSSQRLEHAFFGFRNAGFTCSNTSTQIQFPERATKFLRLLFEQERFDSKPVVERLGVRSKFCVPYDGDFEELNQLVATKYVTMTPGLAEAFGEEARLIDIGAPLNFEDDLGNFNTSCGPMGNEQLKQFFRAEKGLPAIGLFFDIDYYVHPGKRMSHQEVQSQVQRFSRRSWERHAKVLQLVLE